MRQRKKGMAVKPSGSALFMASIDSNLQKMGFQLLQRLTVAEMERNQAVKERDFLKFKLVSLLNAEQIDAAKTCECEPEIYAIECIEMFKEKIFPQMPGELRPLYELKHGR